MNYLQLTFCRSQTGRILEHGSLFDPKRPSHKLIHDLSSQKELHLLKKYLNAQLNEEKELRMLGLLSVLLIHSPNIEQVIEQTFTSRSSSTSWMFNNLIFPFRKILLACCETPQMFSLVKDKSVDNSNFLKEAPYLVRILQQLCKLSESIIKMGRYLLGGQRGKTYQFFAECFTVFLSEIYCYLRVSLQSFLYCIVKKKKQENSQVFKVLRWILGQVLPEINETIDVLCKCKYFSFQKKGIVIEFFKAEQQSVQVEKMVTQIVEQGYDEDAGNLRSLKTKIFAQNGSINRQLFLSKLSASQKHQKKEETAVFLNLDLQKNPSTLTAASESIGE